MSVINGLAGCGHDVVNAGSIEYSIWDDLMTEEGELWQPTEEDTTLSRCRGSQAVTSYSIKCSFHLS